MILIGYRHDLRASELSDLQWSQGELNAGRLHHVQGDKIRALRRLQRGQGQSLHVFNDRFTPESGHYQARSGRSEKCQWTKPLAR